MDARAWAHDSPTAEPSYVDPLLDVSRVDSIDAESPARGERVGSCRMMCRSSALQLMSRIGLIITMMWIAGSS